MRLTAEKKLTKTFSQFLDMNNFKQKSPYASKEATLADKFHGAHRNLTYKLVFEERTASLTDK